MTKTVQSFFGGCPSTVTLPENLARRSRGNSAFFKNALSAWFVEFDVWLHPRPRATEEVQMTRAACHDLGGRSVEQSMYYLQLAAIDLPGIGPDLETHRHSIWHK